MGTIIAFSGIDGSGKTTAAKLLEKMLERQGFKVMYHHELDFIFSKAIKRLFDKCIGTRRAKKVLKYLDANAQNKLIFSILDDLIFWLNGIISYFYFRLKRGIIIHDRWIYDHTIRYECTLENIFMSYAFRYFPARPDIVILFDVPPEVAYLRKRETHSYDLEYYVHARAHMLKIASLLNYNRIIDSRRPPNEIANEIICFLQIYNR